MAGFSDAVAVTARPMPGREGAVNRPTNADAHVLFDVTLDPDWGVNGRPNGGYLLAAMANAGSVALDGAGSDHQDVIAASATYLSAPKPGPATITVKVLRHGKSGSQVRAELSQDDQPRVAALINYASLPPDADPWWSDGDVVELPDPSECFELPKNPPGGEFEVTILGVVRERLDPSVLGFAIGQHTNKGELRGWLDFRDDRPLDCLALIFAADSFPPAVFDLGSMGWVPTLQLSVYVRALPAPGPLRIRQRARLAQNGTVDEVCDVWDSNGRLVAQGTQLAGFRP